MNTNHKLLGLLIASLLGGTATAADLESVRVFNIKPQKLESALIEFSKQADMQVIGATTTFADTVTQGVSGEISSRAALNALLQNTSVIFNPIGTHSVQIVPSHDRSTSQNIANPLRTLLAQTESVSSGDQRAEVGSDGSSAENLEGRLEEIVVTAQKRVERLQDVPISISVLGGERLDSVNTTVVDQLARVPGMAAVETPYGSRMLTVRGVAATGTQFAGTSAVGYYLDSVPFGFIRQAYVPDSSAYDLDRVEVLRGPQGTLYGVSALNGVVRVLTKDADLENFELKLRGSGSSIKDGGEGYRVDSALNLPLMPGRFALRAVVGYEDYAGWIDTPVQEDYNGGTLLNARVKLKAKLTENFTASVMGWHSDSDADGYSVSLNDGSAPLLRDQPTEIKYDVAALNLEYEMASFTIKSATSWIDYSLDSLLSSATLPPTSAGNFLATNNFSTVLAQEVYLVSTSQGRWRWSVGGIYRDAEDEVYQNIYANSAPALPNPNGLRYQDFSKSYAVFGELTRQFFDGRLELSGGLRYFKDDNEVNQLQNAANAAATLIRGAHEFDRLSPRAVLSWHPASDLTLYASYGEGFRSGFSQSPSVLGVQPGFPSVEPDHLNNYEIGAKGDLFNGLASFETAVYFMDWTGTQQSIGIFVPALNANLAALVNGKSASGIGAEGSLTVRPVQGLELGASYSWNNLEFDEPVITNVRVATTTPVTFVDVVLVPKDGRLSNSPARTAGAFADYRWPVGSLEATLSGSVNYLSKRETRTLIGVDSVLTTSDNSTLARASVALGSPAKHWTATLFVENLTGFDGVLTPLAAAAVANAIQQYQSRARPRTIGLQVEFKM